MKKLFLVGCLLVSSFAMADEKLESLAKKTVENFLDSIQENSAGVNVKSNWDKLKLRMLENANDEVVGSILNESNDESFNSSFIRIMNLTSIAQTMILANVSPEIIEVEEQNESTKFNIRSFSGDSTIYEVTCVKKEEKKLFWKSIKEICKITAVNM